jgi:hypothetical protein
MRAKEPCRGESCRAWSKENSEEAEEWRKRCGPLGPSTDLRTSIRSGERRPDIGVWTSSHVETVVWLVLRSSSSSSIWNVSSHQLLRLTYQLVRVFLEFALRVVRGEDLCDFRHRSLLGNARALGTAVSRFTVERRVP